MVDLRNSRQSIRPDEARLRHEVYQSFPDIYGTIPILERYLSSANTCRESTLQQCSDLRVLSSCMVEYANSISRRSTRFSKALCQPQKQIVTLVSSAKQLESSANSLEAFATAILRDFERVNDTATVYFKDLSCGELQLIEEISRIERSSNDMKRKTELKHEHYRYFIGEQRQVDAVVTQFSASLPCRMLAMSEVCWSGHSEKFSRNTVTTPVSPSMERELHECAALSKSGDENINRVEPMCASCGLQKQEMHANCSEALPTITDAVVPFASETDKVLLNDRHHSGLQGISYSVEKKELSRANVVDNKHATIRDDRVEKWATASAPSSVDSAKIQATGRLKSEVHSETSHTMSSDGPSDVLHVPSDFDTFSQLLSDARVTEAFVAGLPELPLADGHKSSTTSQVSSSASEKPQDRTVGGRTPREIHSTPANMSNEHGLSTSLAKPLPISSAIAETKNNDSMNIWSKSNPDSRIRNPTSRMARQASTKKARVLSSVRHEVEPDSPSSESLYPNSYHASPPRNWNTSSEHESKCEIAMTRPFATTQILRKVFRSPRSRSKKAATTLTTCDITKGDNKLRAPIPTLQESQHEADVLVPPKPFVTDVDSDSSVGHWYHM